MERTERDTTTDTTGITDIGVSNGQEMKRTIKEGYNYW